LADGEVDKQINNIAMTLLLMVFVCSGIFIEIENSQSLESISEDNKFIYMEDFEPMLFHTGLYYVIVTISTVGYGDINANVELSKVCTMLLIILTVAIVPS
jgi:hypothetical protein